MGGTLVRGGARQKVGWQGRRPAGIDVAHCAMARRISLLFALPISMRITRDGISEQQFCNVAKGI